MCQWKNKLGTIVYILYKRCYLIVCLAVLLTAAGCSAPASNRADAVSQPEVYVTKLGGGYGVAVGAEGELYAAGTNEGEPVLWKITGAEQKDIYAVLDYHNAIAVLLSGSTNDKETNMAVDGAGNIWMTGLYEGQCYAVTKERDAITVYLNKFLSVSLEQHDDDARGIAWDEARGKLAVITAGPTERYGTKLIRHISWLTPSADGFFEEVSKGKNYYIENNGILLERPGVALVKSKTSPLYYLGNEQVFTMSEGGELTPFGEPFAGMRLYGGATDESGNLYVSANSAADADDGKGIVYRIDADGKVSQIMSGIGKPLGIAWGGGYLYVTERAGDRVLRLQIQ